MAFKNILVPYDGSEHARLALHEAMEISEGTDATIHILNVIASSSISPEYGEPNPFWSSADLMDYDAYKKLMVTAIEGAREGVKKDLAEEIEKLGDRAVVDVVTFPSTARAIADFADKHDIDLIVMGRRGLGAIRGMIGSVSYSVLGQVDIPVLTVK